MKRATVLAIFFLILGTALGALYRSQRRLKDLGVSPNAILNLAADAQRDLGRVPMHFTRLSDEEEIRIGNELASRYTSRLPKFGAQEEALQAYARRVGGRVATRAHRRLPYTFHLLPNDALINAFSLPGGHVFIGEGMLNQLTTEDELANVLGHEIEHVDHYHCVERVQIESQLRNLHLEIVGSILQIPLEVWERGYSKDQELEADREGMRVAVLSGYSPYGAVTLFEKFAQMEKEYGIHAQTPEQELSELVRQSLEGYFRSHPQTSERLAQANNLIAQEHWQSLKQQKVFHVEYEVHNGTYVK
jgi:predicted Zn-dependent protease